MSGNLAMQFVILCVSVMLCWFQDDTVSFIVWSLVNFGDTANMSTQVTNEPDSLFSLVVALCDIHCMADTYTSGIYTLHGVVLSV